MHKKFTLGFLFIFLIGLCYSMPAQSTNATDEDDENEWKKWDDGENDDYEDYSDNDTLTTNTMPTTANSLSAKFNSNNLLDVITNNFNNFKDNTQDVLREPKSADSNCPQNCHCTENYDYVNCSNKSFANIPNDFPKTALKIDLSNNKIENIRENDFSECVNVKEIILHKNKISNIELGAFSNLTKLEILTLSQNDLSNIHPDTFTEAIELRDLDLSGNPIILSKNESFLNQPNLMELNLRKTNINEIYDDTFKNLTGLSSLKIDNNDFNKKINTKAFKPLKNLVKLYLPELNQDIILELCQLLQSIDNVSFKHFAVSCFEFVLGQSFNDSIIQLTDSPPTIEVVSQNENDKSITTKVPVNRNKTKGTKINLKMTQNPNQTELIDDELYTNSTTANIVNSENVEHKVAISSQTINNILIGIIILACVGLLIGVICRKDYFGIKTKLCRTKKPNNRRPSTTAAAEANRPTEELPLNKI